VGALEINKDHLASTHRFAEPVFVGWRLQTLAAIWYSIGSDAPVEAWLSKKDRRLSVISD
jgi:hypothetical protein